jgi:hypothetical protein
MAAAANARDLRGREGYHLAGDVVAKGDVEIVKVAPGGSHDEHAFQLAGIGHGGISIVSRRRRANGTRAHFWNVPEAFLAGDVA